MFDKCHNLEKLNISNFKITNNSNNIKKMFDNLANIQEIKVNNDCIDIFKESFKDIKEIFYS